MRLALTREEFAKSEGEVEVMLGLLQESGRGFEI